MIGVIADPAEYPVIREFFELFKTPWELFRDGRRYDVVLCAGDAAVPKEHPGLVVVYSGAKIAWDADLPPCVSHTQQGRVLTYKGERIPLYGNSITGAGGRPIGLCDESTGQPAAWSEPSSKGHPAVRVGYDLFQEVRLLLAGSQPAGNAAIPTLDLHIEVLRNVLVEAGVEFAEIPPVPAGYRLVACLTHDVDHPLIERHKFDRTMVGFVYRATIGSVRRFMRRRLSAADVWRNWAAAARLPLVYLGVAKDFWSEFADRYLQLERGLPSSFFVIPFQGQPGFKNHASAPRLRASGYGAEEISAILARLQAAGCEVGLHGIDAWRDREQGERELEEIGRVTGRRPEGVRMHWLYYDEHTPRLLEGAGAKFDSTVGYNETVGFRAGTAQVYRPLSAADLLELPLHIMDTALFYPSHLNLSPREADARIASIVKAVARSGGCVTVNWHDRSVAPERLWVDSYVALVDRLKNGGAWFATASEAVAWFRARRAVTFEDASAGVENIRVKVPAGLDGSLPPLQLRVHRGPEPPKDIALDMAAAGACAAIP